MADLEEQEITQNLLIVSNAIYSLSKLRSGGISQILTMRDLVTAELIPNPNFPKVEDDISISQIIDFSIEKFTPTFVSISQSVSRLIDRERSFFQNCPIDQTVVAYLDKNVSGSSGSVFVDPAIVAYENSLVAPEEISLTCVDPAASIYLRKPEFGDSDSYNQFRVERNTLGGDLQIFRDAMWPDDSILKFNFEYLNEDKANELLHYLIMTLGQKMTLIDHFGRSLTGFILTPFEQILEARPRGWSASFSFQQWVK